MNKFRKQLSSAKGFTLVELLIVIALIAILSVGVLSTINPIEQRNKATDANTSNDAGEVLNAYERFYANSNNYPWMVSNNSIKVNDAWGGVSNRIGAGLCGHSSPSATEKEQTQCESYNTLGTLVSGDELKSSFLNKTYTQPIGTDSFQTSFDRHLYVFKAALTDGNSISVCFIPQAKTNRKKLNNLKKLTFGTVNGVDKTPTAMNDTVAGDYTAQGDPKDTYTFEDEATSLYKCIP